MKDYDNKYYVYAHSDPNTQEVVYVGMGCGDRAWAVGSRRQFTDKYYKRLGTKRRLDHYEWLQQWLSPLDYVQVLDHKLYKDDASMLEKGCIEVYKPRFNTFHIPGRTFEMYGLYLDEIRAYRKDGLSDASIGQKLGLATMSVHRRRKMYGID